MLHREPDESGGVDWRQFSGLDLHGEYDTDIPDEECETIARMVREYENAILTHEIRFLEFMKDHFVKNRLRHFRKGGYYRHGLS